MRLFAFVATITFAAQYGVCNPALFISTSTAQPLNASQMFSSISDPFAVELSAGATASGLTPQTPAAPQPVETSSTFALDVPSTFTMGSIDRIVFQRGTVLEDPVPPGGSIFFVGTQDEAPEPPTWGCVGGVLALLGLATYRERRIRGAGAGRPQV